jgi:Rv0078B-related antitoxin
MEESPSASVLKLRAALDLFDVGVALMRENLKRARPTADEHEIDDALRRWLHERPGAEFGDCPGRRLEPFDRLR